MKHFIKLSIFMTIFAVSGFANPPSGEKGARMADWRGPAQSTLIYGVDGLKTQGVTVRPSSTLQNNQTKSYDALITSLPALGVQTDARR